MCDMGPDLAEKLQVQWDFFSFWNNFSAEQIVMIALWVLIWI